MKRQIVKILKRKRSAKNWCAIGVLTFAVSLELMDAAFGLTSLAADREWATSNVIDVADVVVGATAAWLLRS